MGFVLLARRIWPSPFARASGSATSRKRALTWVSIVQNHSKTHTTLHEVMDQVARSVHDANPDATPRRVGTRADSQVSARQRDTV